MGMGRGVSISLLVLACFQMLPHSYGMKCYQCEWVDGRGDRECLNSPPPSRYLRECSNPQCYKKYSDSNGVMKVLRYCSSSSSDRSFCQQSSFENPQRGESDQATECFCKTEGCNGSSKLLAFSQSPNYGAMITLLLASSVMLVSRRVVI